MLEQLHKCNEEGIVIEMRGAVCLFMKEDAEQGMGKDKMACSSEWLIARGVHSRASGRHRHDNHK